jgi:hypothetical protein
VSSPEIFYSNALPCKLAEFTSDLTTLDRDLADGYASKSDQPAHRQPSVQRSALHIYQDCSRHDKTITPGIQRNDTYNTTYNPRYRTTRHEEEEPLPWLEHQAVTEHAQHHAQCAELGVTWEQNPLITTPSLNNTCTLTHTTNAYIISDIHCLPS